MGKTPFCQQTAREKGRFVNRHRCQQIRRKRREQRENSDLTPLGEPDHPAHPYRAVLIPEESYQDLRQEDGRDFLIDNMLELTLTCDSCRQQRDTLTPDGGKDAVLAVWLCGQCREGEE